MALNCVYWQGSGQIAGVWVVTQAQIFRFVACASMPVRTCKGMGGTASRSTSRRPAHLAKSILPGGCGTQRSEGFLLSRRAKLCAVLKP